MGVGDNDLLTDGGVFDNLGLRHMQQVYQQGGVDHVLVSDAGAPFCVVPESPWGFAVVRTVRTTDILMKRIADLEYARAWQFFLTNAWHCRIDEKVPESAFGQDQRLIAEIRTDLDAFSDEEVYALIRHGYDVASKVYAESGLAEGQTGGVRAASLSFLKEPSGGLKGVVAALHRSKRTAFTMAKDVLFSLRWVVLVYMILLLMLLLYVLRR